MLWYRSAELLPKGRGLRATLLYFTPENCKNWKFVICRKCCVPRNGTSAGYKDAYWRQLRFCRSFEISAVLNHALS